MASNIASLGGYDCDFVEPPPSDLICLICTFVPKEPMQMNCCGNVYCTACLNEYKKHSNKCPQCRIVGNCFYDRRSERHIKALKVKCDNLKNGCNWTGELAALNKHLASCDHALLSCPNQCKDKENTVQVLRKDLEEHLTNKCPYRSSKCPHCQEEGKHCDITTSHLQTCPQLVVACPNEGCNEKLPRCDISNHREACPFESVTCKYSDIGCEEKLLRKELDGHEEDDKLHLSLAMETILKQEDIISQTQTLLGKLRSLGRFETVVSIHGCYALPFITSLDAAVLTANLSKISNRWYEFGLMLEVPSIELRELDKVYSDQDRFTKLIEGWLKRTDPAPSWSTLQTALKIMQEEELAVKLAKEFVEGGVGFPDYKTQKKEIQPLLQARLQKGHTWYLVDIRWMKQWRMFVGYDTWDQSSMGEPSANPGPVDNSNLFKELGSDELKDHLMEELDYYLLPEPAWRKFVDWYGLWEPSKPIARKVVEHGLYLKHYKVEVYLLQFKLCLHPNITETHTTSFSRADTVADLETALKETFDIAKEAECRVWHRYMTHTYELLSKPTQYLQDAGLYNGQTIVLEKKGEDGTWPRASKRMSCQTSPTDDGCQN